MATASRPGLRQAACAIALSCCAAGADAQVPITIINTNDPGVGFNDPTPAYPVGGNSGKTLGQQRLIAFQRAADLWGATLTSGVPIRVAASFEPLSCNASSAVLGSASAYDIFSDFPNAPASGTWYPSALASKLAGVDQATPDSPHILARFNSRLGASDCLAGSGFYLGLDNQAGGQIDLVTVLLHEFGHGLGFQTFTDGETGEQVLGVPSIWDYFLFDDRTDKRWVDMTDAERVDSAISGGHLSWAGANVTAAAAQVLAPAPSLSITGSAAIAAGAAGNYPAADAAFGPRLGSRTLYSQLMPVVDQPDGSGTACSALSPLNTLAVRNNIALVDRGTCPFATKARMVQEAGAIGMVVVDDQPGAVSSMTGAGPDIVIPSVYITHDDGARLKAAVRHRSRTMSGVTASLGVDPNRLAGTSPEHRMLMYTPGVIEPGSSVTHYATGATPDQLMEPSINQDLSHDLAPPHDLTFPLLRDIGW